MAAKTTKPSPKKPKARSTAKRSTRPGGDDPGTEKPGAEKPGSNGSVGRAARSRRAGATAVATPPAKAPGRSPFLARAVSGIDDDDVLMARGGGGEGFGRCGGRMLSNRLEQQLCSRLSIAGVVHSHSPRHYEIRYEDSKVAAYAPMIVLRGRGREGKGVVIEAIEDPAAPILRKVVAFRQQYGQEFYVILVAADDVLDDVPVAAYDESCSSTNVNTLIARLAE